MDNPGLPPPTARPDPLYAAVPGPPSPYRDGGLIPPAGSARTWGLTVIGVPLLLILLLGLVDGSTQDGSGSTGDPGPFTGLGTGSQSQPEASPATPYTDPVAPDTYGTSDTATTSGTTEPGDIGDLFGTSPDHATATGTETPTSTSTATAGPEAVVTAYFAAINNRDYQTAWDLGGKNLHTDYASFASGFATTQRDTINVVSVQGAVVRLVLDALETDGTSRSYDATYTVRDGEITGGTATPTS